MLLTQNQLKPESMNRWQLWDYSGIMKEKKTHVRSTLRHPPHSQHPQESDLSACTCLWKNLWERKNILQKSALTKSKIARVNMRLCLCSSEWLNASKLNFPIFSCMVSQIVSSLQYSARCLYQPFFGTKEMRQGGELCQELWRKHITEQKVTDKEK